MVPIPFRRSAVPAALVGLLVMSPMSSPMARAHQPAPAHGCMAPVRPVDDQNDVLWQQFLDQVDAFRACISAFVAANHRASDLHREAANEATLHWNRFVRAELNVPEDYPWPPPERLEGER